MREDLSISFTLFQNVLSNAHCTHVADTGYEADYGRKLKPFCDVIVDENVGNPQGHPLFAQLQLRRSRGFSFPVR